MSSVTSIAQWSADRHISQSGKRVVLQFDREAAARAAELYRSLALLCIKTRVTRLLIVLQDAGEEGERALRDAMTTLVLAGIPSDFRLALVTPNERGEWRYRVAQRDLCAALVDTRVFDTLEQAQGWLDTPAARARARP